MLATAEVSREVRLQVVGRDGGLCGGCGRTCAERDVWRRLPKGEFGDTLDSFSLMCPGCRALLCRELPGRGARREHWLWVERVTADAMVLLFFFTWGCFAAAAVWAAATSAVTVWGVALAVLVAMFLYRLLQLAVADELRYVRGKAEGER